MSKPLIDRITHEMALRTPQEDYLRKFSALVENIDLRSCDQQRIRRLLEDQSRKFPNEYARLTFVLATGVGKTRLMGSLIADLFLSGKAQHFVIMAPSSTIYKKLLRETSPTDAKYLFTGLTQFPRPKVFHAGNWTSWRPARKFENAPILFILTPGQVRAQSGNEATRRMRSSGDWGSSLVENLSKKDDLIIFLDEGHRYGQDAAAEKAWAQAIADLKPKLVLEMTATPSNESTVLYPVYDLRDALGDGKYIKDVMAIYEQRPNVVDDDEWDRHTLSAGLDQIENKRAALETLRRNQPRRDKVKPIALVSCRDTSHAAKIEKWLESKECKGGKFKGKVLRVDVTQSADEIEKLLNVEDTSSPIEIVINVGMLREGWDVKNVYVIIPLRAMLGETLAVQTIGRGLRLPFGERTTDLEVDTLDVLCFGRETVQAVIAQAKQAGVRVRPRKTGGSRIEHTSKPSKPLSIEIPDVNLSFSKTPVLKDLHVRPTIKLDGAATVRKKISLHTGAVTLVGQAMALEVSNIPRLLGQLLLNEVPEFGGQEKEAERVFKEYFKAGGCQSTEKQRQAAQTHGDIILKEVASHARTLLQNIRPKHDGTAEARDFSFGPIAFAIPNTGGIIDQSTIASLDEAPDSACLISGWKHSLYPECRFGSNPELMTARVLDGDTELWVRNPDRSGEKGFFINTLIGRHYPDFIVVGKKSIDIIEVKDHAKLQKADSLENVKARAAREWCNAATKAGNVGWRYFIIPDVRIERCSSVKELIQAAHA